MNIEILCQQKLVPKITEKEIKKTYLKQLKSFQKEWLVNVFTDRYIKYS